MYKIKTDHNNCRGRPPNKSPCREGPYIAPTDTVTFVRDRTRDTMNGLRISTSGQRPLATELEHMGRQIRTNWIVNYRAGPFNLCLLRLTLWPECINTDNRQRIPIPHVRARAWVDITCFGSSSKTLNRHNHITITATPRQSAEKRNGSVMPKMKQQLNAVNNHYYTDFEIDRFILKL